MPSLRLQATGHPATVYHLYKKITSIGSGPENDIVLPDPLVRADGTRVASAHQWQTIRRPEVLRLFATEVYGRTPANQAPMGAALTETDRSAFGGRATRKQVTLGFGTRPNGPAMHLLIYLPHARRERVPVFVGLNFRGNHAITGDPAIRLSTTWLPDDVPGVNDEARGRRGSRRARRHR